MKKFLLLGVMSVMAMTYINGAAQTVVPDYPVNANGSNPGLIVSSKGRGYITTLPKTAQDFINRHFSGVKIVEVERDYPSGEIEVALKNGYDLEFTKDGVWNSVEAPKGSVISQKMLKEILPGKAYSEIEKRGYIGLVNSVEREKNGHFKVEVDIVDSNEFIFDLGGYLIRIDD